MEYTVKMNFCLPCLLTAVPPAPDTCDDGSISSAFDLNASDISISKCLTDSFAALLAIAAGGRDG